MPKTCVISFFAAFAVLLTVKLASAQTAELAAPRIHIGHPSTLWDEEDIEAYQASFTNNPGLKAAFDDLRAWGDKRIVEALAVPAHQVAADGSWNFPEFKRGYQDASGKWMWEWNFNTALQQRSADVSNLGMLYALTGDAKYANFARRILLEAADAYGNGKGSAVPDTNGYDHFGAYGFDGGDAGMFLAKACHGYVLIYNLPSITTEDRARIEGDLIRPMAEHLKKTTFMYKSHGRWGMVCLYGVFIAGATLNDQALVDLALYGPGGTEDNLTGGFMDCFTPACLRDGVVWGADVKPDDQMASVSVLTAVAEVMWRRGVDLYQYQGMAMKKPFDAALAGENSPTSKLVHLTGIDAYPYAYAHYKDSRYLPLLRALKPNFTVALGEHLPSPPLASQ